ncbi:hypothetical protein B0F90DRAFT_1799671 [Multifurca ochricompacta]|uniref:RRM domain-containing protein n=1 Tax=Multifurca ochricompacta TaxID=376703 RepID=A0AAD4LT53_9AGAM|nr:hypothetical protein B0F90DRAFT_1799671 [Multifurca ochricompacta]
MAPFKSSGKSTAKSRASDDTVWVHDRAPGAPRNATQSPNPNAPPSNKLMITNLHYEITPKDLTAIFGQIGTLVREPFIRYDRSGRSSGVAIITFETLAEATRAKKQLDGVLAKGQPISIEFDQGGPRHARAPASSLLSRIQKPPLLNRLSQAQNDAKASLIQSKRVSSIRGRGRGPGTGPARGRISTPLPKSAAELDSELDAFMSVDSGFATPSTKPAENGDMEMA